MRLGFHYHITAQQVGDQIVMPGFLGRFLDSLAAGCTHVTCFLHTPRADELAQMDYTIQAKNLHLVSLGDHASVPVRLLRAQRIVQPIRACRADLDIMLIRGPSPLLPAVAEAVGSLPVALLLVGDYLAGIDDLPQPRWRKEAIRLWAAWNYRGQKRIARRSLVLVNSQKLYQQMQPVARRIYETRTTTLSQHDFYEREDTCQSAPCRLLYTGRMDRGKGLLTLAQAVHQLIAAGENIEMHLVGWAEKGDSILEDVLAYARAHHLESRFIYHGYKAMGSELFGVYQMADVYVIASESSEGFPRTIWEAMAHSLPVVATTVGSIPFFLADGQTARLVEPRSVEKLAAAIAEVLHQPALRRTLIHQGRELARQNTLENRTQELLDQLTAWVDTHE